MKHKKCVVKTLYKENTNGLLVVFTLVFVFIESGAFFLTRFLSQLGVISC